MLKRLLAKRLIWKPNCNRSSSCSYCSSSDHNSRSSNSSCSSSSISSNSNNNCISHRRTHNCQARLRWNAQRYKAKDWKVTISWTWITYYQWLYACIYHCLVVSSLNVSNNDWISLYVADIALSFVNKARLCLITLNRINWPVAVLDNQRDGTLITTVIIY